MLLFLLLMAVSVPSLAFAQDAESANSVEQGDSVATEVNDDAAVVESDESANTVEQGDSLATEVNDDAAVVESDESANTVEQGSLIGVEVNDSATVSAYEVVTPIEDTNFGSRVAADIGFSLLYDAIIVGIGSVVILANVNSDSFTNGQLAATITFIELGLSAMPGLAVHSTHSLLDGMGKPAYGYLGGIVGTLGGELLGTIIGGVILHSKDSSIGWGGAMFNSLCFFSWPVGIIGGIVGSIVWYEHTDTVARQEGYFAVKNLHPVIDITPEQTTFGIGFQF